MNPTLTDPCARLEANRIHLRIQLLTSQLRAGESATGGTPAERLLAWWKTLPFAQALGTVSNKAQTLLRPVATRYPGRLMLGAMLAGAVIVWIRPWRWFGVRSVAETLRAGANLVSTHDPKGEHLSALLDRLFSRPDRPD